VDIILLKGFWVVYSALLIRWSWRFALVKLGPDTARRSGKSMYRQIWQSCKVLFSTRPDGCQQAKA